MILEEIFKFILEKSDKNAREESYEAKGLLHFFDEIHSIFGNPKTNLFRPWYIRKDNWIKLLPNSYNGYPKSVESAQKRH